MGLVSTDTVRLIWRSGMNSKRTELDKAFAQVDEEVWPRMTAMCPLLTPAVAITVMEMAGPIGKRRSPTSPGGWVVHTWTTDGSPLGSMIPPLCQILFSITMQVCIADRHIVYVYCPFCRIFIISKMLKLTFFLQNANLLSASLCLIKELDLSSLEVIEHAVRCRIDELHAQTEGWFEILCCGVVWVVLQPNLHLNKTYPRLT